MELGISLFLGSSGSAKTSATETRKIGSLEGRRAEALMYFHMVTFPLPCWKYEEVFLIFTVRIC